MGSVTIEQIAGAIGVITVIAGFIGMLIKLYSKNISDKFNDHEKRLNSLEEKQIIQDGEIQSSKDERRILIQGILACLKGLQEQGCNGTVTATIKEIEQFMIDNSHK